MTGEPIGVCQVAAVLLVAVRTCPAVGAVADEVLTTVVAELIAFAFAAVPVVFWFRVGTSAATRDRNVGAAALPLEGPAKTLLADCVARTPVNVPDTVTGEPLTVIMFGKERATLVTVPARAFGVVA